MNAKSSSHGKNVNLTKADQICKLVRVWNLNPFQCTFFTGVLFISSLKECCFLSRLLIYMGKITRRREH